MRKNHLRIVNRKRFVCTLVVIFLSIYLIANVFNTAEGADDIKCVQIHIKYGDTIWALAKEFSPKNKDIRKTIYRISIINDLDTLDIYPGQVIKIPLE
ncbi:LysM peptidoglycan-binding domain-containing protein [Marinisporobacter balticus]|uniref:LysM domain-containing protein n=1 Tax=Marinisporobacter balticus TaxID=2018667 RepID=A0A4R2L0X1_9FIRM|nr:LysM peptidoglycan-binding domain-containing protein [Marinisporobacter balticus]TCO79212.1 LysM domain-containing protein [Marinisporobacter balticus]